ncbi:Integrase IntA (fragment) [Agrobacterium sp. NCPPB 925]
MAKSKTSPTAVERRAEELDTIASVLPLERRDELTELLTDQDIETLRHLVNQGMGANTLRALTSDLTCLEAWGLAATGQSIPWPAPEALLLKFVAHHLWDPEKRANEPDHGMPPDVDDNLRRQGLLKSAGPHAPDTVRRRLASWSTSRNGAALTELSPPCSQTRHSPRRAGRPKATSSQEC